MYFDIYTLTGLLVTLPYIVMLVIFSKKKSTPRREEEPLFDCLENEPYRYGT